MKKFDKAQIIPSALWAFLVFILLLFSYTRAFDEFEFITLDLRYRLRPPQKVSKDIVIVEISDDSIDRLDEWPFPRSYHALLLKALSAADVKTVIFDIFFSEAKKGDKEFAAAVKSAGNVYFPYIFDLSHHDPDKKMVHAWKVAEGLIEPLKEVCKGSGFINVVPDEDGNVRKVPAFIEFEGEIYPHMSVEAAINDLGYEFEQVKIVPEKKIVAGDITIPIGEDSEMLINYPAPWGKAFRHYSYVDIIQSYLADVTGREPSIDLKELKGAVCLIGRTATASPDIHPSPMEPIYPGVGVNASVYNSIVMQRFLWRLNRWWNLLILVFMWALTGFVTYRVRKAFSFLSIFLIMSAFVAFSAFFCWSLGVWVDIFYPLLTMTIVYIVFMFRRYVKEAQIREVMEKELNIAKDIQQSFLPQEIPQVGNLDIDVRMWTARQVGGDLYDIVKLADNKIGLMMGDVSGKGVPAALFMARVVTQFKIFLKRGSPSVVLKEINNQLVKEGSSNLFVTVVYMTLDTKENKVKTAIGGHLPTVMIKPDGEVDLLDVEEGLPLGLVEGEFSEREVDYPPGSAFILYTDGVTEAMNDDEEMFGHGRLVELARSLKGRSAKEIVEAIHSAVMGYAGKAPQHDDITVMAIKT